MNFSGCAIYSFCIQRTSVFKGCIKTKWPEENSTGPKMRKAKMTKFLERSAVTIVFAVYGLALLPLLAPGLGIA